jgi:ATPase subunit of ABC transporter with duplicated ATPase domains
VAEDAIVEIDLGKYGGNLTRFLQRSAAQENADGDERQAQQKERGKKRKKMMPR